MTSALEHEIKCAEELIRNLGRVVRPDVFIPTGRMHDAEHAVHRAAQEQKDVDRALAQYVDEIQRQQDENNSLIEEVTTLEVYLTESMQRRRTMENMRRQQERETSRLVPRGPRSRGVPANDMSLRAVASRIKTPSAAEQRFSDPRQDMLDRSLEGATTCGRAAPAFVRNEQEDPDVVRESLRAVGIDLGLEVDRVSLEERAMARQRQSVLDVIQQTHRDTQMMLQRLSSELCRHRYVHEPRLESLRRDVLEAESHVRAKRVELNSCCAQSEREVADLVASRRLATDVKLRPLREHASELRESVAVLEDEVHAEKVSHAARQKQLKKELRRTVKAEAAIEHHVRPVLASLGNHVRSLKSRLSAVASVK